MPRTREEARRNDEAERLIHLMAALLEDYSRPGAINPKGPRTPTVQEVLAKAKTWLEGAK